MNKRNTFIVNLMLVLLCIAAIINQYQISELETKQKQQYVLIQQLALNDAEFNKILGGREK